MGVVMDRVVEVEVEVFEVKIGTVEVAVWVWMRARAAAASSGKWKWCGNRNGHRRTHQLSSCLPRRFPFVSRVSKAYARAPLTKQLMRIGRVVTRQRLVAMEQRGKLA